jgi:hypothetical protein
LNPGDFELEVAKHKGGGYEAMSILRVFPRRTSMTPDDDDSMTFIGDPPLGLWRPPADEVDEVHISCTFTWDIEECKRLAIAWSRYYDNVKLGGPAFNSSCNGFIPGRYVKRGVTFTTRGCNNSCPWCFVPRREGKLREIEDFAPGYIVQDNNLLQASRSHIRSVIGMLKTQKAAVFAGGIDARLVDDWFVEQLQSITVKELFLAADTETALQPLEKALDKLSSLGRNKLRVYVLIAYGDETVDEAKSRLERVWDLGGLPFAQLYQPPERIEYSREWKNLARRWSRPAIVKAMHND